jgi:hypothetical protein
MKFYLGIVLTLVTVEILGIAFFPWINEIL